MDLQKGKAVTTKKVAIKVRKEKSEDKTMSEIKFRKPLCLHCGYKWKYKGMYVDVDGAKVTCPKCNNKVTLAKRK